MLVFNIYGYCIFHYVNKRIECGAGSQQKIKQRKLNVNSLNETVNTAPHSQVFLATFSTNILIGFLVYLLAIAYPQALAWLVCIIEELKPTFKALQTATVISSDPFPTQVMMLYATASTIPFSIFLTYCIFFVKRIRQSIYKRFYEKVQKRGLNLLLRFKLAGMGIFLLIISISLFPMLLLVSDSKNISWRTPVLFSSSIGSSFFLLLVTSITAFSVSLGLWFIYMSINSFKPIEGN